MPEETCKVQLSELSLFSHHAGPQPPAADVGEGHSYLHTQVCHRKPRGEREDFDSVCPLCMSPRRPLPLQDALAAGGEACHGSWSEMLERRLSVMYLLYLRQILHG